MSLQLALLVIGIVVVAAIYFLGTDWRRGRRSKNRRRGQINFSNRMQPPVPAKLVSGESKSQSETGRSGTGASSPRDQDFALENLDAVLVTDDEFKQLPTIRRETDSATGTSERRTHQAARALQQMELDLPASPNGEAGASDLSPAAGDLLVLYLKMPDQAPCTGSALAAAMTEVGMEYGALGIYHHHGVGTSRSDTPMFSVANMYEPGHFENSAPEKAVYSGLSMFLQLPGSCEGSVAVELFVNTAQRLAALLNAQLLNQDHRPLSKTDIEQLRLRAGTF